MKHNFSFFSFLPVAFFLALLMGLSQRWAKVPSLARLLSPFSGVWQKPEQTSLKSRAWSLNGLSEDVQVVWDASRVPHVFAKNENDLAFGEGFVHASQRLFQMELQSRAGGGRLSEIFGQKTVSMDVQYRRMGLHRVAEQSLRLMMQDPELAAILNSYTLGVNAYIATLSEAELPTEYRFLNIQPAPWTPLQTAEFLSMMVYRLSGRSYDLALTVLARKIGMANVRELFPEFLKPENEAAFILHPSLTVSEWNLNPPKDKEFISTFADLPHLLQPFRSNGSNNWAIAKSRSLTGHVILANDTHLGFSAPGVWFEQQLLTPKVNVYGGGFAGAPGVMSGFTERMAWAVTNGTADVMDWYDVEFKDGQGLEYKYGEDWKVADLDEQTIIVYGSAPIKEKILWTLFGPVVTRQGSRGLALKWTAHEGSLALKYFLNLNRGQSHEDCKKIVREFDSPNQNFICADKNQLSITHAGLLPRRWRGQGQFILNGSDPEHLWGPINKSGEFLYEENSEAVSSANQRPVFEKSGLYLGAESENSWRGLRIRDLLQMNSTRPIGMAEFIKFQTDDLNPLAQKVLPIFLSKLKQLSQDQLQMRQNLINWDFHDSASSAAAGFFYHWWRQFEKVHWQETLGEDSMSVWPREQFLAQLISDLKLKTPASQRWLANSFDKNVNASFQQAWDFLIKEFGSLPFVLPLAKSRQVKIPHIGRFPGLEIEVVAGGGRQDLNAMQKNHGPTWRMIVELGDSPSAVTSIPGTSAGDPLSFEYDTGFSEWAGGYYKSAQFFYIKDQPKLTETQKVVWNLKVRGLQK